MATPSFGDSQFLVGACPQCQKEVLTHIDFGPDDSEIRRCVHCDEVLELNDLAFASGTALEEAGYALLEARLCGNGGGCSAGGCGSRRT
jgi:hypothetical protein